MRSAMFLFLCAATVVCMCASASAQCNNPDAGDCCTTDLGQQGCEDTKCCETICQMVPSCCNVGWGSTCSFLAQHHCVTLCGGCGSGGAGDCCATSETPFCSDAECCETVCGVDPFCCENEWDQSCADLAWKHCPGLPGCAPPTCPGEGSCCAANDTPFCSGSGCCNAVCAEDPYCCEVEWDECCAHLAFVHCNCIPSPPIPPPSCDVDAGDCCSANGTPGCEDSECCAEVCALDNFCCDNQWDSVCVEIAKEQCFGLCFCGPDAGNCCIANGTPGCEDPECCTDVCALDNFCCDFEWDTLCVDIAWDVCFGLCSGHPSPPTVPAALSCRSNCGGAAISGCWCDESCCQIGDCCEDKGRECPGCLYGLETPWHPAATCNFNCDHGTELCSCDDICLLFGHNCCWDVCTPDACPHLAVCEVPNPANLLGEDRVNIFDLLELLTRWGECEYERCFVMEPCEGDFNHDGRINVEDLMFLLQNWGE